jgi:hypothetical protein
LPIIPLIIEFALFGGTKVTVEAYQLGRVHEIPKAIKPESMVNMIRIHFLADKIPRNSAPSNANEVRLFKMGSCIEMLCV